jgi:hypothetical protein
MYWKISNGELFEHHGVLDDIFAIYLEALGLFFSDTTFCNSLVWRFLQETHMSYTKTE